MDDRNEKRRPDRLLAGQVGKPHGLHGEVYVVPISDDPHRFAPGSSLISESGRLLVVESSRPHHDRLLVHFEEVVDRAGAEQLRGALYVEEDALRELDEGEYWSFDLEGCTVTTTDGTVVGHVERVDPGTAHDMLVVGAEGRSTLVPMVKGFIVSVDLAERAIVIAPPEGLLEL